MTNTTHIALLGRMAAWRGHAAPAVARSYADSFAYLSLRELVSKRLEAAG